MLWSNICKWVAQHNVILSFIVASLGVIASIIAVAIAWKVFREGLKINRDKVLDELSLELVTEFIIPFRELRSVFKPIKEEIGNSVENSTVDINTVHVIINGGMFQAEFSYFESHKGDIWDSLQTKKKNFFQRLYRCVVFHIILAKKDVVIDDNQARDYRKIIEFIDGANRFCNGLKVTKDALYKYMNDSKIECGFGITKNNLKKKHENATVGDFYKATTVLQSDKRFLKDGIHMMDKLDDEINNLPDRLQIEYMKSRLAK